jgi:hypothetical protein
MNDPERSERRRMVEEPGDSFTGSGGFEKGYDLIDSRVPEAENLAPRDARSGDSPVIDPFDDES